ncbi:excalibur calcium-binding domain-containing protein [Campylobacter fetus]|uniref:excalibur calcium-binding domain-containing protein n=1 Tax=Campylobacter fetus TaxID=196 RepID=UPI00138E4CDD|nr:excalibur calcium-binding domain-containing protein [Campylobacter fetus]
MKKILLGIVVAIFAISAYGVDCSVRKMCKQMSSCAEAYEYLNKCGHTRLDRDRDGVPCESICR